MSLVVSRPDAHFDPLGLGFAAAANISFAVGVVLTKTFPAPRERLAATGWQLLLSAVIIVPLVAQFEGVPSRLTAGNLAGLAYISLAATGLASVLWFNGVAKLPTQAPPLLGLASAATGVALGWLLLGQSLTLLQLVGFVVTVGAIAYGATLQQDGREKHEGAGRAHGPPHVRPVWSTRRLLRKMAPYAGPAEVARR